MLSSNAAELSDGLSPPLAFRTTDGGLALHNLQAQLASLEREAGRGWLPHRTWRELVDLLALRGEALGRMADQERAAALADRLVGAAPGDGLAYLARARMRATFHRFAEALADLDQAEQLGVRSGSLMAERAAALHHLGRCDDALALARAAADQQPTFISLGTLAVLHAERGDVVVAETFFAASRSRYRSVSPFPLAQLDVQQGRMWQRQDDHPRARTWFAAALRRVPGYAPALGPLATLDVAMADADGGGRHDG